jgi:hypothetical protein
MFEEMRKVSKLFQWNFTSPYDFPDPFLDGSRLQISEVSLFGLEKIFAF